MKCGSVSVHFTALICVFHTLSFLYISSSASLCLIRTLNSLHFIQNDRESRLCETLPIRLHFLCSHTGSCLSHRLHPPLYLYLCDASAPSLMTSSLNRRQVTQSCSLYPKYLHFYVELYRCVGTQITIQCD